MPIYQLPTILIIQLSIFKFYPDNDNIQLMLKQGFHIRFRLVLKLALHWEAFVLQYRQWICSAVFENVAKILACRTYKSHDNL